MDEHPAHSGLRAARTGRGWSQSEAVARLAALAGERGVPVAVPASLKTQLSRWENGHALPEPQYRGLLAELYGRTPAELGLVPRPDPPDDARAGLRAAVAEASAAGAAGPELWWDQLTAARRLDDELGAAGAGGVVDALVERLAEIREHTIEPRAATEVSAVLSAAATLGAAQSLDRGRHDLAWRRYGRALSAARAAALPAAAAAAVAGRAEVLVDAGDARSAVTLLGHADPGADPTARIRHATATALAAAAAGDRDTAVTALAGARRHWRPDSVDLAARDGPVVEVADLHRWHGRTLVELGDCAEAAEPLGQALAAGPRSARDRAAVHADLATALRAERPDASADHASAARALATAIGSARVAARLAGSTAGGGWGA